MHKTRVWSHNRLGVSTHRRHFFYYRQRETQLDANDKFETLKLEAPSICLFLFVHLP